MTISPSLRCRPLASLSSLLGTALFLIGGVTMPPSALAAPREETSLAPRQAERIGAPLVDEIMEALARRDFAKLARFVGAEGLLLSPYLSIGPDHVRLASADVARCGSDPQRRRWGDWDGSGDPILMTCKDYFDKLVWVTDFRRVGGTTFNKPFTRGTDVDNHLLLYPNAIVAWRHRAEHRDGKGTIRPWQSLHLIFARSGGRWTLRAIARGTWTI
jgi:hypothetical protein